MKTIKMILLSTGMFLILTSGKLLMDNLTFSDWDENGDGLITRSEFVDRFTANYVDDWNVVDDEHLDDEDFYRTTYGIWDEDDDELLSEQEWMFGYDYYYGDYILDDYVGIDADGDGFIEYTEYYDALSGTDYYSEWDVDEDMYLNEYELARMVFNNWDYDDSNFIEKDEYEEFDTFYLDI